MLVSPELASNLLFVGQLVDNNCNVNFSRSGSELLIPDSGAERPTLETG